MKHLLTNEPRKHWSRWPLAVWEGLLFGWFVLMAHVAAQNLISIGEYAWRSNSEDRLPRLTVWMKSVFPEETWSLLTGVATFGIGFALISLTSNEAPSSRMFRWAAIAAVTMLVGVALPVKWRYSLLSGGFDETTWDEVLFVGSGLISVLYGVIRLRRARHIDG